MAQRNLVNSYKMAGSLPYSCFFLTMRFRTFRDFVVCDFYLFRAFLGILLNKLENDLSNHSSSFNKSELTIVLLLKF